MRPCGRFVDGDQCRTETEGSLLPPADGDPQPMCEPCAAAVLEEYAAYPDESLMAGWSYRG